MHKRLLIIFGSYTQGRIFVDGGENEDGKRGRVQGGLTDEMVRRYRTKNERGESVLHVKPSLE
jgi:hypothetical protein